MDLRSHGVRLHKNFEIRSLEWWRYMLWPRIETHTTNQATRLLIQLNSAYSAQNGLNVFELWLVFRAHLGEQICIMLCGSREPVMTTSINLTAGGKIFPFIRHPRRLKGNEENLIGQLSSLKPEVCGQEVSCLELSCSSTTCSDAQHTIAQHCGDSQCKGESLPK